MSRRQRGAGVTDLFFSVATGRAFLLPLLPPHPLPTPLPCSIASSLKPLLPVPLQWILSRFDWVVFGNEMKWYSTNEGCRIPVDYSVPDAMLAFFDKKKVKVRGHTLFWDRAKYNTECVQVGACV